MNPWLTLALSVLGLLVVYAVGLELAYRAELKRRDLDGITSALRAREVDRQRVLGRICGFCDHDLVEHDGEDGPCRRPVTLDQKFSPVECFCHQWMPSPPGVAL